MRTCVNLAIFLTMFWPQSTIACEPRPDDNALLAQILRLDYDNGSFAIVDPMATSPIDRPEELAEAKRYFRKELIKILKKENISIDRARIDQLLDRLIAKNSKPARLTLNSSRKNGYLIDYNGKYDKYFEKDGGGWEKWSEENPQAWGRIFVSLPVFDKETGFVLVSYSACHRFGGGGHIVLYKYVEGRLVEQGRVMTWIS